MVGWGELCPGERRPWNGDDSHPRSAGTPQWSGGLQVPAAEEIPMTWCLLAFGFELGGRAGKSAVFCLVGNKLE